MESKIKWTIVWLLLLTLSSFAQDLPEHKLEKLFKDGNFAQAYDLSRDLLLASKSRAPDIGHYLDLAQQCLTRLNRINELDTLIEQSISAHPADWELSSKAAYIYARATHWGFMVSDRFERGWHRGGGKRVNSIARDRARAIQLAWTSINQAEQVGIDGRKRAKLWFQFADFLTSKDQPDWIVKLQTLTSLESLPDYEEYEFLGFGETLGIPELADGSPVFYSMPESFTDAKNDGERYRWALHQAIELDVATKPQADFLFANFLLQQFDVRTLANTPLRAQLAADENNSNKSGTYALHTLSDEESIVRFVTGIKRIKLPDEFNYLKILKSLLDGPYESSALMALGEIYEDRRQLPIAASYWQKYLIKFGELSSVRQRLDQIIAAWGTLQPGRVQVAGENAKINYRFRNGTSVKFTAHKVKVEQLINDIQKYLKSEPKNFDWSTTTLNDIGQRLVLNGESQYIGDEIASWHSTLEPLKDHFDREVELETPLKQRGVYLLSATMASGNTTKMIVWLSDCIIVRKPLNDGALYFVADALTGRPLANMQLEFFGFRANYINNSKTNEYKIVTSEFTKQTDNSGQVRVDAAGSRDNQWLIAAKQGEEVLAFLGFDYSWWGSFRAETYRATKVYSITDRPVYRPEQEVRFKLWADQVSYAKVGESKYAGYKFNIQVKNAKDESVFQQTFSADRYGGFDGKFSLSKNANLGIYSICWDESGSGCRPVGSFRVEEYKKPEFEVLVEAPTEPVALGQVIETNISAKYYFGEPVREAKIKYKVLRYDYEARWFAPNEWDWFYGNGYWWFNQDYTWYRGFSKWGCLAPMPWWNRESAAPEVVAEGEAALADNGQFALQINTDIAKQLYGDKDQRYNITVEVTDRSRRTIVGQGEILVASKPYKVNVWLERGYYSVGDVIKANFKAITLNQKGIVGKGTVNLFKSNYDSKGDLQEKLVQSWEVQSDADGNSNLDFKAASSGQYRLSLKLQDSTGHIEEGAYIFVIRGDTVKNGDFRFDQLEIIPDKKQYAPGDKANILLTSAQAGTTILLFARPQNGVYLPPKIIQSPEKIASEEIVIEVEDMPNIFVEAITVSHGQVITTLKEIAVPPTEKLVNVDMSTDKNEYKPGEEVNLELKLSDQNGKPTTGSVVLTVYDRALEYISSGSNVPEIREFFWKWRKRHNSTSNDSLTKIISALVPKGERAMGYIGRFGNDEIAPMLAGKDMYRSVSTRKESAGDLLLFEQAKSEEGARMPASVRNEVAADAAVQPVPQIPMLRKAFADSAVWLANITPDQNGRAKVNFKMPDNLSSWKMRAWAMAPDLKVGEKSFELITKKNLLIRLQAPRFFLEKDEVVISANVHNYLASDEEVDVSLELDGGTLANLDSAKRSIALAKNSENRIDWRVKVLKQGEAILRVKALGQRESDAMEMPFPVYVHGFEKFESYSGAIGIEENSRQVTFTIPEERKIEASRIELHYSPTLAGAIIEAIPFLVSYPYGCTEQTLNRFLPTVMTQRVLNELGIDLGAMKRKHTNLNAQELGDANLRAQDWARQVIPIKNPVFDTKEVENMSKLGVEKLLDMQLADGGWGWFSGQNETASAHTTAYVVRGLNLARKNAVNVSEQSLLRGLSWLEHYQAQQLQELKNAEARTQPFKHKADNLDVFVYMVLVEAGRHNSEMQDFLYRDRIDLAVYSKAMFAWALLQENANDRLKMLVQNIEQYKVEDAENQTTYLRLDNGNYWWYWYGSEYEAQAFYLKLLSKLEPKSKKTQGLVKYLLNNRKHATYWNSTRDTALVLEAFADYLLATHELAPQLSLEFVLDGKSLHSLQINKDNIFDFNNSLILSGVELSSGEHQLEIRKQGLGPLYYNLYVSNFSLEDPISKAGLEIKVARKYFKITELSKTANASGFYGQIVTQKQDHIRREELVSSSQVKSGDVVEVELEIESKNDYEYLIFEDYKPAGFESVQLRSGYIANELGAYMEFRDNLVASFVRSLARGKHSLTYRLRAEVPGRFSSLPTRASAMYAPELRANSDEHKLLVGE